MIQFKCIRWKNLLSTGNVFTEIKFDDTPNALIIGENGAGKSTILDALTFVLFGKPFRKINKPGLVNSINKKECVVEIEFSTNNKEYKIIRGIKPNVFEIYCDGLCLNQDSASRDYQEHLEKFILKMNMKSFTQIVILGSASFTPFMQLSPADRRAVIEDLLDIQIFTSMNNIVKLRLQTNKEALDKNRIERLGKDEKKDFIERTLSSLRKNNEQRVINLKGEIEAFKRSIESWETQIKDHEYIIDELLKETTDHKAFKSRHNKLIALQAQLKSNMERYTNEIEFYGEHDNCPTCHQSIDTDFKETRVSLLDRKTKELETKGITKIAIEIEECVKAISNIDFTLGRIQKIRNDISDLRTQITIAENDKKSYEKEVNELQSSDSMIETNEQELWQISKEIARLDTQKQELINERQLIETAITLLKDGGIKTRIIKQYLPIINKQINKYLLQMGFFCQFQLDENFEETIKSRFRDDFAYQNFSEGEKFRIDLAILLAWRSVARMRNSVNTNILIFDEIFDSSLDINGTDEFLKIMWSLVGDTNAFVISHKQDQLIDKFQKVYRFGKRQNYSRIIE